MSLYDIIDLIVQLYGEDTSKLEMFAREKCIGWDSWGNEVDTSSEFRI